MFRARQAILVTIAAAVLTATVSACEGNSQPAGAAPATTTRPAVDPLKGLTSYEIIGKAFANTDASPSVQLSGLVINAGQQIRLSSLTLVNGGGGNGCIGDFYQSGAGTFQMIYDGTTVWVLPNPRYWQLAGANYAAELPALEGRYLQLVPGGQGLGALVSLCSLSTLIGTGPNPTRRTGLGKPVPTVVGTLPALKIHDTADGGYAIVSDTATPRLLSAYVPGRGGYDFKLGYSATPVTLAAPVAKEVVDGTQYGL